MSRGSTYLRPRSLAEALEARAAHPDWAVIAGGTDLLVGNHRPTPPGLLDLWGLGELSGIAVAIDGTIRLGAATTFAALLGNEQVARELPALSACAREVGALQIQARGTIGGNLATSSPVGDTLPVWLALDATIELASIDGRRTLAYADFLTGYRTTALGPRELISAILIPPRRPGLVQFWRKIGTRRAQSISKVMVAGAAVVERGVLAHLRLGLGAVADRPIRALTAEAAAIGERPDRAADRVRTALMAALQPIDDMRSTAAYRREVTGNVVARFVAGLATVAG